MKSIFFTKEGLAELQKEYDELMKKRKIAVQELSIARDMGDRSENAAYKSARFNLSGIDRKLSHLTHLLKHAQVVEKKDNGKVQIGSIVTISDGEMESTYTIVGGYESDLNKGRLSCYSPIGKALMHKRNGDQVKVQTPGGVKNYSVNAIA